MSSLLVARPSPGKFVVTSAASTPRRTISPSASRVTPVKPLQLASPAPAQPSPSSAALAAPAGLRSARSVSTVSTAASSAFGASTGKAKGSAVHKSAKQVAEEAKKRTELELSRHLQALLHLKQRLRRAHDDAGKEYSGLHTSLGIAREMMTDLDRMRSVDLGVAAIAVLEKERDRGSALQAIGGVSSSSPQSSPRPKSEELQSSRGATDTSSRAVPLQQHASVLDRNSHIIHKILADGAEVLQQLNLSDRELQHLMTLVDRAADVDMQCMSGAVTNTVTVNGSPLYPTLTLNDADGVMARSTAQCAKAGRFSTYVRRLLTSGMSEVTHSAEHLATAMKTCAKVAAEQAASLQRELESALWEERRAKKRHSELTAEAEQVLERLKYIHKTLRLREAALMSGAAGVVGSDPVIDALREEEAGVQVQLNQLETHLREVEAAVATLSEQRQRTRLALSAARAAAASKRQSLISQQHAVEQLSPSRLGSRATSPRPGSAPAAGPSPRPGGGAVLHAQPFRTYGNTPRQLHV